MDSGIAFRRLVKLSFPPRGRIRRILLVVAGTVALFAGACIISAFLAAPWAVDRLMARFTSAGPERSARVETVRFNPFTLQAELESLRLQDGRAQSTFSASAVTVKLKFRSLLERRLSFQSILIESPDLELTSVDQVADLSQHLNDEWVSTINIEQLEVTDGRLATTAESSGPSLQLSEIYIGLTEFDGRTQPPTAAPARVTMRATTASGGKIDSDGSIEPGFTRTTGRLALVGLELETMRPSLRRWLPVAELSGTIDLSGDYILTAPLSAPVLEVMSGRVQIRDFALAPVTGFSVRADEMDATANLEFAPSDGDILVSGRMEIAEAKAAISDARIMPPQIFEFANAAVLLTVNPDRNGLSIAGGGELADAGYAMVVAQIPADVPAEQTLSFEVADLPAAKLSSYAAEFLGRGLSAGRADINLDYSFNDQRVTGILNLVSRELTFTAPVVGGDAPNADASLDLAAALLVNAEGVINLNLPFAGNTRSVRRAIADALRARLATLTDTPFDAIAPLIAGDVDTVRVVPFVPGDAALGDRALATIDQLADVLNARPRLGLRVHGGYDASADRVELARQQIQLHVLLATAGPSAQSRPQPIDFDSARAQEVLDEFAGERLPPERIEAIASLFNCEEALTSFCRRAYYAALFDALVAREEITDGALNRLGRFRALTIVEGLTQRGINPVRIEVVTGAEVIDYPFGIGLPVELTVAALR